MRRRTFLAAAGGAPFAQGAGMPVRVDGDGMLIAGGRRKFITGLYQLPKVPGAWAEAAGAGFNLVHTAPRAGELDLAHQHGLHAWVSLGSVAPSGRAASEAHIRNTVLALKDKPALAFWETEDEPAYVWKKPGRTRVAPEAIIATREFVRRLDPAHPFYLNHAPTNLVATLRRYNDGAEILATDVYPVAPHGIRELYALWPDGQQGDFLNREISQVGQYADKMRQVAGGSRAVFLVLQAFAWEDLRKQGRDPAMVLYPDRSQLRFMTYQAIAHGVNGVLYWGLSHTPPEAALWTDLKAVALELASLAAELAAPSEGVPLRLEYHDTGHSLDRGIEHIVKRSRNGAVIVAVNADKNPVEVSISGLERFRACEVLFENRRVALAGGTLHDRFPPFQARVYRVVA